MFSHKLGLVVVSLTLVLALVHSSMATLVSHWSFDVDYTDSGPAGNNGSLLDTGATGDSYITNAALFGSGSMSFGFSADAVKVTQKTLADGVNDPDYGTYTLACWARKNPALPNEGSLVGYNLTPVNYFWWIQGNNTQMRWCGLNSEAERNFTITLPSSCADAEWHHYVLVAGDFDADGTNDDFTVYADGIAFANLYNMKTRYLYNSIGSTYNGDVYDMVGQIDEVRVYDHPLTSSDVQTIYESEGGQLVGVISHWTFDSDYTDSARSANDGSMTNNSGPVVDGCITNAAGLYKFGGGAASFSAERDYVDLVETRFNYVDWSVAFWAKQVTPTCMVMGYEATTYDYIAVLWGSNDLYWRGHSTLNGDSTAAFVDPLQDSDTNWHHYALVGSVTNDVTGIGTITAYCDGECLGVAGGKGVRLVYDAIGVGHPNYSMNGQIDEVWVFNIAITAGQVQGLKVHNEPVELPARTLLIIQ